MFNSKIINIGAIVLLVFWFIGAYKNNMAGNGDSFKTSPSQPVTSKLTLSLDPNKRAEDMSFTEKMIYKIFGDKIDAAKHQSISPAGPVIYTAQEDNKDVIYVKEGDMVRIKYFFNDRIVEKYGREGTLTFEINKQNSNIPRAIKDSLLGMKKGEVRRIGIIATELDPEYADKNVIVFMDVTLEYLYQNNK